MLKPTSIQSFKNLLNLHTPLQIKKELATVSTINMSVPVSVNSLPIGHVLELMETTDQKELSFEEDNFS
jgi:hypothetical protein